MKVSFKSLDNENNEITFSVDGNYINGYLVFEDSVVPETLIYLKSDENYIELLRKGKINMSLTLETNKKGTLKYKEDNLYFELEAITKEIKVNDKEIYFEYDLFDDIYFVGNHKIWIKLQ